MVVPRWHGGTTPHGGAAPVAPRPWCQGSRSGFHQDGHCCFVDRHLMQVSRSMLASAQPSLWFIAVHRFTGGGCAPDGAFTQRKPRWLLPVVISPLPRVPAM